MCLLQVPNGRMAAPAGGAAQQLPTQQQHPKGSPGGAAAAAASADDGQLGDVPKLSPAFEVRTARVGLSVHAPPMSQMLLAKLVCIILGNAKHALLAQCQPDATSARRGHMEPAVQMLRRLQLEHSLAEAALSAHLG